MKRDVRIIDSTGACLDIGAQRSCIGLRQTKALCKSKGRKLRLAKSNLALQFGDKIYYSLGTIEIIIPTPDGSILIIKREVVRADVPFLVRIDVLDKEGLVANNVSNKLEKSNQWSLLETWTSGYMYIKWKTRDECFTRREFVEAVKELYIQRPICFMKKNRQKCISISGILHSESYIIFCTVLTQVMLTARLCESCRKYLKHADHAHPTEKGHIDLE